MKDPAQPKGVPNSTLQMKDAKPAWHVHGFCNTAQLQDSDVQIIQTILKAGEGGGKQSQRDANAWSNQAQNVLALQKSHKTFCTQQSCSQEENMAPSS